MPFRRYAPRSRYPMRRRRGFRRTQGTNWAGVARKAYRTAKFVASVINPEQKFYDLTSNGNNISSSSTMFYLTAPMIQGVTASTRNGISVKAASELLNMTLHWNSASGGPQRIRWILFYDTNLDGVYPTGSDVLQGLDINAPLNAGNAGRFTILLDKVALLDQYHPHHEVEKYIKLKHHLKWAGGAGIQAEARDGNLFLLAFSDAAATVPTLDYYSRFRFYDN